MEQSQKSEACFLLILLNNWSYDFFLKLLLQKKKFELWKYFEKEETYNEFIQVFEQFQEFKNLFLQGYQTQRECQDILTETHCQILIKIFGIKTKKEFMNLFETPLAKQVVHNLSVVLFPTDLHKTFIHFFIAFLLFIYPAIYIALQKKSMKSHMYQE